MLLNILPQKKILIATKWEGLKLLFVLKKSGKESQDAALEILRADERVSYAYYCNDVPFETVNTLSLSASSITVMVGETLTINLQGEYKRYYPPFEFGVVCVTLKNYNPLKEYSPADFPQVQLASVSADGDMLTLKLAQTGYYDTINAVNKLARDLKITIVCLSHILYPVVDPPRPHWVISDTSVAEFVGDRDYGDTFYGYPAIIKGLKPGRAVITYVDGFSPYPPFEITVVEGEAY